MRVLIPTYLRAATSRKRLEQTLPLHKRFFKEYLISFLIILRLIDFATVILQLLMFKVCGITGISKIEFLLEKLNYQQMSKTLTDGDKY